MPEGHVIHREARLQARLFVNRPIEVWSPQGRFSDGARLIDGNEIVDIEPRGKHLFYEWDSGLILHIHLGLFGRFRRFLSSPPQPTDGTRLAMAAGDSVLYLSGPMICDLISEGERDEIVARIGPDPLGQVDDDEAKSHISEHLSRRKSPVSAALLDQAVVAGIGNVYRSEILFLTGINPMTPSSRINQEQVAALWDETRRQLGRGEKSGKIVTTQPIEVGASRRSEIGRGDRLYVYQRQGEPCRRCGTPIDSAEVAYRSVWMCPSCQPA